MLTRSRSIRARARGFSIFSYMRDGYRRLRRLGFDEYIVREYGWDKFGSRRYRERSISGSRHYCQPIRV